ncbi:2157_t:CDS:1, partial [Paraglomus occultum]
MDFLQNPVPLYCLGVIPAVFIIADSPFSTLTSKVWYTLACLSSPFTPLFYYVSVGSRTDTSILDKCCYWLPADKFEYVRPKANKKSGHNGGKSEGQPGSNGDIENQLDENERQSDPENIWPFAHENKRPNLDPDTKTRLTECVANISFCERYLIVVSIYFIVVGMIVGIYRDVGKCQEQDWPAIPLLLCWALPALLIRLLRGKAVVRDPEIALQKLPRISLIDVNNNDTPQRDIRGNALATLLVSILSHWLVVIFTYYTKPKGFGCRSIGLALIAGIWTLNSTLSFRYYFVCNNSPPGVNSPPEVKSKDYLYSYWLCPCGVV